MRYGSFISETDNVPFFAKIYLKIFGAPLLDNKYYYKIMRSLLNLKEDELILDFGTAGGINAISITREGFNVVGFDIRKEGIEKAVNRSKKLKLKSNFVIADGTATPFKSEIFDKIICLQVLEHIIDDMKAISEIYRLLKKGGEVCLAVPYGMPNIVGDLPNHDGRGHVREGFTTEYLETAFKKYGFKLKSVIYSERVLAQVSRRIYYKIKALCNADQVFFPSEYTKHRPISTKSYVYVILPILFPILDLLYSLDLYMPEKNYINFTMLFKLYPQTSLE